VNEILKQRLVGALILIALGVVFWPIIFVEPGDSAGREGRGIPERPEVSKVPIPAPSKEGLRATPELESRKALERDDVAREAAVVAEKVTPASNDETTPEEAATKPSVKTAAKPAVEPATVNVKKTRTEAPVKPTIDAQGVPLAWILQVASVGKPDKAEELRIQLLAMGHKAYVKKIHRGETVLLRVYIGPKFERAALDKIKAGIDAKFGVESIIVRYTP
jgi:DedD protein